MNMFKAKIKNIINYIFLIYIYMGISTPLLLSVDYLYRFNYSLFIKIFFIPSILIALSIINHLIYKYKKELEIF